MKKWDMRKVVYIGLICGAVYGIAREVINFYPALYWSRLAGAAFGGAIGGVFVLGTVGLVRNGAASRRP